MGEWMDGGETPERCRRSLTDKEYLTSQSFGLELPLCSPRSVMYVGG